MQRIRIATRKSELALWQARHVQAVLAELAPEAEVELMPMSTQGDQWLAAPLSEIGGKGLFIKELEQAMLAGSADIAVHSMKDVPAQLPSDFALPVIAFRDDVRDAVVGRSAATLAELPPGAVVGSASLRRGAQILARFPQLQIKPIRGNVQTRLAKLDAGDYDAIILACAGLARLGLSARITEYLAIADSLPAAGQGALGIECRADASELLALLARLNDPRVAACVQAERAVSGGLGADCSMPVAAYAEWQGETLVLQALLASADGQRVLRAQAQGTDPERVGQEAAQQLLAQGGDEILAALTKPAAGT